jgi:Putative auto-transporter adhesin, head GIN domain
MKNAQSPRILRLLIPVMALSLSACSSGSSSSSGPPATSGHTVIIGQPVANGPALKGTGKWTAIKRTVEQFHAIDLRDAVEVRINVGAPLSLSVEADDNLISVVDTRVENGKLIVSVTKSFQSGRSPELVISVPELSEVTSSGAGQIVLTGVKGDVLNIDLSGAGNLTAMGNVQNLTIKLSGAGKADCIKLLADNVKIDSSGAGNCYVDTAKSLNAKLSGAGNIQYRGAPASLTKSDTGAGEIAQFK